ncbi:prepilin-type N-terminal cleavage/methylation domain-containing protein [Acinetobacter sp. ANC 5380]|uniref:Prepilin-type N-terminal cleavage/methylation domain-containing protein n=1 Tax=Acinetobacter terrae TaxID=2731247 RepID=A0A7Y2RGX5_9GAMM|nr:prepilin-type N-terminal cleavage/methylation domain-containing protein [Acinetobacter terrae]NNH78488.1 prepilin-type N-terminal cleavage/methylation domain-containing protein [Acinetobacter terrae]
MQRKEQGFTLIELMVTIAVLAIIVTMAAPSFGNLVAKKRLDTAARDFALVFGEARGQAISLRKNITIKLTCPTEADPSSGETKIVCPANTATTFSWISPDDDIELTSDAIDVVFTGLGSAKQRTKMINNPHFDNTQTDSLTLTPSTDANPSKIEEIVPLEFTLCNAEIETSKIILVSKTGTVDSITTGVCS